MHRELSLDERRARSAVLIRVPNAFPLVGETRRRYTADGSRVPPHITVLSPFLAPSETTAAVHDHLLAAASSTPSFTIAFSETGWFEDRILYLRPEPADPILELIARLREVFPMVAPYWNHYGAITPHMTVADANLAGGPDRLREIESSLVPRLPLTVMINEIALMQCIQPSPYPWNVQGSYPLA